MKFLITLRLAISLLPSYVLDVISFILGALMSVGIFTLLFLIFKEIGILVFIILLVITLLTWLYWKIE